MDDLELREIEARIGKLSLQTREDITALVAEVRRLRRHSLTCIWCQVVLDSFAELRQHTVSCNQHPVTSERRRAEQAEAEVHRLRVEQAQPIKVPPQSVSVAADLQRNIRGHLLAVPEYKIYLWCFVSCMDGRVQFDRKIILPFVPYPGLVLWLDENDAPGNTIKSVFWKQDNHEFNCQLEGDEYPQSVSAATISYYADLGWSHVS